MAMTRDQAAMSDQVARWCHGKAADINKSISDAVDVKARAAAVMMDVPGGRWARQLDSSHHVAEALRRERD